MIVDNTTILSGDEAHKMMVESSKPVELYQIILLVLIASCGLIMAINGAITEDITYATMGSIFVAIAIVYTISIAISKKRLPKKVYENNKVVCDLGIKYIYKFKEQSVMLKCETPNKSFKIEYKYSEIKKVFEYNDGYLLKLSTDQILYVKKEGFENPKMIDFFIKNLTINKKKIIMKRK